MRKLLCITSLFVFVISASGCGTSVTTAQANVAAGLVGMISVLAQNNITNGNEGPYAIQCPNGGSYTITNAVTNSQNYMTNTITFTNCKYIGAETNNLCDTQKDITINGAINYSGAEYDTNSGVLEGVCSFDAIYTGFDEDSALYLQFARSVWGILLGDTITSSNEQTDYTSNSQVCTNIAAL